MPDTSTDSPQTKKFPVRAYFHDTDPETGDTRFFHPDGDFDEETGKGFPGASAVFVGDPNSKKVAELKAGAGGTQGPLIEDPDDEKKSTSSSETKKTATSTAGATGKES